jgi:hypothetical protein
MCAVPRKRKFRGHLRLREALDAKQNFEPFGLVQACDWRSSSLPRTAFSGGNTRWTVSHTEHRR